MKFVSVLVAACCLALLQHVAAQSHGDDYNPSAAATSSLLRPKRTLAYPSPSTLLLIFGLGTPLQLGRESVLVGAFAKMIYALPSNASDLSEPAARHGVRSRWSLYRSLAQLAQLYGFGEGKSCVLRSICEAAAVPFHPARGLLHQLLQAFLSPASSKDEYEEYQDREYHVAERLGRRNSEKQQQAGCHALYPECRASLLDVFSSSKRH